MKSRKCFPDHYCTQITYKGRKQLFSAPVHILDYLFFSFRYKDFPDDKDAFEFAAGCYVQANERGGVFLKTGKSDGKTITWIINICDAGKLTGGYHGIEIMGRTV